MQYIYEHIKIKMNEYLASWFKATMRRCSLGQQYSNHIFTEYEKSLKITELIPRRKISRHTRAPLSNRNMFSSQP